MKLWIGRWFPSVWPDKQRRFRVAGEYRALATSEHLLADLCARNFVFAKIEARPGTAPNLYDIGIAAGRRECVLEILELAGIDPRDLIDFEFRTPARGEDR